MKNKENREFLIVGLMVFIYFCMYLMASAIFSDKTAISGASLVATYVYYDRVIKKMLTQNN